MKFEPHVLAKAQQTVTHCHRGFLHVIVQAESGNLLFIASKAVLIKICDVHFRGPHEFHHGAVGSN